MKLEFVPAGRIVSVHGIRGELKVLPLEKEAEFLIGFQTFYLEGRPVKAVSCRVHKAMALLKLEGVEDRTAAEGLRGKELLISRRGSTSTRSSWAWTSTTVRPARAWAS